jgi:hypothetical protein
MVARTELFLSTTIQAPAAQLWRRRQTSLTSSLHLHLHLRLQLLGHRGARPSQRRQTVVLDYTCAPTGSRPGTSRPLTASAAAAAVPHPPVRGRPKRDTRMGSEGAGEADLGGVVVELQRTAAERRLRRGGAAAADCVVAAHVRELVRGSQTLDWHSCVAN